MNWHWRGDEAAMQSLAEQFAQHQPWPLCIHLHGDLGAGKTTLARAWLRAHGHRGAVRSPTYTLVEPYELHQHRAFHLDLYRLADPEELDFLGRDEWAGQEVLLLIEWPQRGADLTPPADAVFELQATEGGQQRQLRVEAKNARTAAWLDAIKGLESS